MMHVHTTLDGLPKQRRSVRIAVAAVGGLLAGCASISQSERAAGGGTVAVSEVSITRTVLVPGSAPTVFAFIAAEDVLPKVLTGYGPLPAVVRTSGNTGPWDKVGSARVVHLADGSSVREELTHHDAPKKFAYRVWDFGNPIIGALASEARGEWTFDPTPEGTRVSWTYTFTARNAAAAIPLSAITQILWRGYMNVCLQNTVRILKAH
jgi:hypothetical protein